MIIQTNDAVVTNNVNVSANSSGENSSSHTKITTTTNGKTTVVESNESGSIHVETKNGETTVKTSPGMKVDVKEGEAEIEESSESSEIAEISSKAATIKHRVKLNIFQHLKEVFEKFLSKFKLMG